jgi:hypothetical protein
VARNGKPTDPGSVIGAPAMPVAISVNTIDARCLIYTISAIFAAVAAHLAASPSQRIPR